MNRLPSKGRWFAGLVAVATLFALAIAYRGGAFARLAGHAGHGHAGAAAGGGDVAYYTCSMDPSVRAHVPGSCPICGMALTPVTRKELESGALQLDAEGMQRIGVRFAVAAKQTLTRRVVALGAVVARPSGRDAGPKPSGPEGWVEALVFGEDANAVKAGQAVRVALTSLPLTRFEGSIVAAEPDPEARSARVRVAVADPGQALSPRMAAEVHIDVSLPDRLAVPAKAVIYAGERRIAFVDRGEGRLEPHKLHVGAQADGFVEVLHGLEAGDKVVVSGNFLVAAESRIRSAKLWSDEPAAKALPAAEKERRQKEQAERERLKAAKAAKGEGEGANAAGGDEGKGGEP